MSIYQLIEERIAKNPGEIIVPDDFRYLNSDTGVRSALMRLVKAGKLDRLAQGIYYSPKTDPLIGKVYPSMDDIARKVASRDKATIRPTGITALNRLGLSTQIPLKQVFLTNGTPRVLRIGKNTLRFKIASPKNLSYKGEISGLVILALGELGSKNIPEDILPRVAELLRKEDQQILKHDLANAPRWIATLLINLLKN